MPRVCDVCGKGPAVGNRITTRGKAKYLGGVGTKVTGISRRQFKPNLQRVKVADGPRTRTIHACTQCIRGGFVTKAIKAAPFRLPASATIKPKEAPAAATKSAATKSAGTKSPSAKAAGAKSGKSEKSAKPAKTDKK